jgi:hypothetical protein
VTVTNSKWSTPTLKARWYDDESIAPVGVAVELDASTELSGQNTLKALPTNATAMSHSMKAFVEGHFTTDERARG